MTPAARDTEPLSARSEFPNFDYIRLFAASLVLFSHSFFIAQNTDENEPLVRLLGEGQIFGIYAVCIFFNISGFLVTMSARTRGTLLAFAASRMLRVYPGLFVCQLLTAVVLGAFFTSESVRNFFAELIPFKYAVEFTLDPGMAWELPTVSFYKDPKGTGLGLNGSLWTIQQELACYFVVACLMVTRLLRWPVCLAIVLVSLPFFTPWNKDDVTVVMDIIRWCCDQGRVLDFFWVAPSFFMGALIYFVFERKKSLPAWPLLLCAADLVWAVAHRQYYDHFALYAAYPLLRVATATRFTLPSLKKFGDISYGVYLYGWPCQQAVRGFLGEGVSWQTVFVLSGISAALCAYASWHVIERPALRLKRFFLGGTSASEPSAPPVKATLGSEIEARPSA